MLCFRVEPRRQAAMPAAAPLPQRPAATPVCDARLKCCGNALRHCRDATPYCAANIHFAARSAIISVGELVLPEVMVGMTDASAMRRPATPRKRS